MVAWWWTGSDFHLLTTHSTTVARVLFARPALTIPLANSAAGVLL